MQRNIQAEAWIAHDTWILGSWKDHFEVESGVYRPNSKKEVKHSAVHHAMRKGCASLLDRWTHDVQHRESQLSLGWLTKKWKLGIYGFQCSHLPLQQGTTWQIQANLHLEQEYGWKCPRLQKLILSWIPISKSRKTQDCSRWSLCTSDVLKNRIAAAAKFAAAARLSLVNLNHLTIPVWREETPCERRFGNRGGATTASGTLGHLGAKTKLCET